MTLDSQLHVQRTLAPVVYLQPGSHQCTSCTCTNGAAIAHWLDCISYAADESEREREKEHEYQTGKTITWTNERTNGKRSWPVKPCAHIQCVRCAFFFLCKTEWSQRCHRRKWLVARNSEKPNKYTKCTLQKKGSPLADDRFRTLSLRKKYGSFWLITCIVSLSACNALNNM